MQHPFRGGVSPPPPDAVGGALLTLHQHGTSGWQDSRSEPPGRPQRHPLPCRNRHTAGSGSGTDSPPESRPHRAANRAGIRTQIGGSSPPRSEQGSAAKFTTEIANDWKFFDYRNRKRRDKEPSAYGIGNSARERRSAHRGHHRPRHPDSAQVKIRTCGWIGG